MRSDRSALVQLAALNTMGVLYIVEAGESIQSVADLKGKTIYSTGQGSTPEYALNLVLEKNGLTVARMLPLFIRPITREIRGRLLDFRRRRRWRCFHSRFVTSVMGQNETLAGRTGYD